MPPAPELDPLTRLAIRFGVNKFGGHRYTPSYHRIFGHLRDQPIRMLEIGVGGYRDPESGGGSLRMWAEYFPFANIIGLDRFEKTLDLPPRVTIVQGLQNDATLLARLSATHGPFDLIIDDGSHCPPDVLASFSHLYPRMSPSGIYIVEDAQGSFLPPFGGNPAGQGTIYQLAHALSLQMQSQEGYQRDPRVFDLSPLASITTGIRFLRNIICFERGDNSYPSYLAMDLNRPDVAAIYAQIEREAALSASPRSVLSKLDMLIMGGRHAQAAALAAEAMRQWPDDAALMRELRYEMARMAELAARIKRE